MAGMETLRTKREATDADAMLNTDFGPGAETNRFLLMSEDKEGVTLRKKDDIIQPSQLQANQLHVSPIREEPDFKARGLDDL